MKKQITTFKDLDTFNKTMESIAELRYAAMDKLDELNAQVVEYAKENEVPDAIWRSIGLEYFHSDRYEQAVEAYIKAVEANKKLDSDDQNYLVGTLGDLAMVYEHMEKYSDSLRTMENAVIYIKDSEKQKSTNTRIEKLRKLITLS